MDLEKIKKNFEWDPTKGDYEKDDVYYERRLLRKKKIRNLVFTILYILFLLVCFYFIYDIIK